MALDNQFSSAVKDWCDKTLLKQTAVLQDSVRLLAEEVGTHVPVVSGNLKNSRTVSSNGYPAIDWRTKKFRNPSDEINNASAAVQVGVTAYVGMRAVYAHKVEEKKPFMRLAAQRWRQIVDQANARVQGGSK